MRMGRILGHSSRGSTESDTKPVFGPGPSRLPGSSGGLTARRSANVEAQPPEADPSFPLARLPTDVLLNIAARLPGEDLKDLAETCSSFRTELSPLRIAHRVTSMTLSRSVHSIVTANRRGANDLFSRGFRHGFNPHQALADLGEALGHGQMTHVADAIVDHLTVSEFAVLKDFVRKISTLGTNNRIDRDPQFQAIVLAQAFFSRFRHRINVNSLNELAFAAVKLCKHAPALKHNHVLSTEASRAAKKVHRDVHTSNLLYDLEFAGVLIGLIAIVVLMPTCAPVFTVQAMLKEDKTSSIALKFLAEVISDIPQRDMSNDLHHQVLDLLVCTADETADKARRLAKVLREKTPPAQRAELRTALLKAQKPTLAAEFLV